MQRKIGFFRHIFSLFPPVERRLTLSTVVTLLRMFLVPCIVRAIVDGVWLKALLLLSVAGLSDVIDGALARCRQEQTLLGSLLDPLADKLLISACFIAFAYAPLAVVTIPLWFIMIVVIKEIVMMAAVISLLATLPALKIQPTVLGKLTTLVQLCAIAFLLVGNSFCWVLPFGYPAVLGMVMSMVFISLMHYSTIGFYYLRLLLVRG